MLIKNFCSIEVVVAPEDSSMARRLFNFFNRSVIEIKLLKHFLCNIRIIQICGVFKLQISNGKRVI